MAGASWGEFTSNYEQVTARRKNGTPTATKTWAAGYKGAVPRDVLDAAIEAGAAREVENEAKPKQPKTDDKTDGG